MTRGAALMSILDPTQLLLTRAISGATLRGTVLANNVANADTPGFRARDLTPPKFEPAGTGAAGGAGPVALATTEPGHMPGLATGATSFRGHNDVHYEVRPTGNAVNLEQEMMKVAANQMDYQTATTLYAHSLNLIKIGLGRK